MRLIVELSATITFDTDPNHDSSLKLERPYALLLPYAILSKR
jgi:hypothetical protein